MVINLHSQEVVKITGISKWIRVEKHEQIFNINPFSMILYHMVL